MIEISLCLLVAISVLSSSVTTRPATGWDANGGVVLESCARNMSLLLATSSLAGPAEGDPVSRLAPTGIASTRK